MASGHVNRIKRPNTWLHRPMLQNVKKGLANPEPSTHVTRIKRPNTWLHRPMLQNVKKGLANPEPSTHGTNRNILRMARACSARDEVREQAIGRFCEGLRVAG